MLCADFTSFFLFDGCSTIFYDNSISVNLKTSVIEYKYINGATPLYCKALESVRLIKSRKVVRYVVFMFVILSFSFLFNIQSVFSA